MFRKVLTVMLMLSIGMVGFSQTDEIKDWAKTVVENSQKNLLDKMCRRLKDRNELKISKEFEGMTESQQFLYQEDLIDSVLKPKSHALKDVFVKLCDKSNMPTDLNYEAIKIGNVTYKTFTTGKKQGQSDLSTLLVPVSFQTHTVVKNKVSDVRYAVTFTWEVKVKEETVSMKVGGKKEKVPTGYTQNGTPSLISSVANPIESSPTEEKDIKNVTQDAPRDTTVDIKDTFEEMVPSVIDINDVVKPIAGQEKEWRRILADAVIEELAIRLDLYMNSHDTVQKAIIEAMFTPTDSNVEVSYLFKSGLEKIKAKSAQKYLSLLRGSALNMTVDGFEMINQNWDSLIYVVNQEYQSKTYSDYTRKRIYLTYDAVKGTYLINKIEVVPNSTKVK